MTTKTFSQTPPDKANELFEQLLATSDNAAKTRERLLSDLKEELDLLANLQEQHLFPVLKKHGMPDLVQEAIQDNQETGALLAELDRMPKNNGEFLKKVAELRKVFQQHIRDDKKELLPAVLKVLSDEEAEAVAEQVQDEMASVEETKRAETKRAREQIEIVRQVADDVTSTVRAGAEGAQTVARTVQEAVQTGSARHRRWPASPQNKRCSCSLPVKGTPEPWRRDLAKPPSRCTIRYGSGPRRSRGFPRMV